MLRRHSDRTRTDRFLYALEQQSAMMHKGFAIPYEMRSLDFFNRHKAYVRYYRSALCDTVLDQLSSEGFLYHQLPVGGGCEVADAAVAEPIRHEARRDIAQAATGWQLDKHTVVAPEKSELPDARGGMLLDHFPRGAIQCAPEADDVRIRRAPCVHQWLHFILRHLRAHGFQRADAAAITARENCLLTLLSI